jgi:hypothetical protein
LLRVAGRRFGGGENLSDGVREVYSREGRERRAKRMTGACRPENITSSAQDWPGKARLLVYAEPRTKSFLCAQRPLGGDAIGSGHSSCAHPAECSRATMEFTTEAVNG